ncbi:hypothetical protein BJY21_000423 [Kineosphaera limosa]|uniref:SseB protein N-terminal domain-containing protein n=1 Tax=Kineosphaera limosa NBRC 100340 TaxID=1184609 RepID=K6WAN5_9MICO|nr:SseB family protein [Kineosphaera limosa]NYD99238.1 hypothetical protein [Kineosphaera limosa]GAB96275.1 hypothetical protein KILIM_034_00240 [Kineosphaera limosa NBRC 100340]
MMGDPHGHGHGHGHHPEGEPAGRLGGAVGEPAAGPFAGHQRLHGHDAAEGADTAGTPWQGREVTGSPFAGDQGEPDAAVRAALSTLAAAEVTEGGKADLQAIARAEAELMAALASARLFVAIEAVASDVEESTPGGLRREVQSDMAMPVLTAPDGRRAMPLFTGLDSLAQWRPQGRPVPVRAGDAARAAVEDACDAVLLDLGTGPQGAPAQVLRLSQIWALAQGHPWRPAHEDEVVRVALSRAIAGRPDIVAADLADGSVHAPGVTRVVLTLREGLPQEAVRELAGIVGESLAADPEVRIRVDDLAMVLRSA